MRLIFALTTMFAFLAGFDGPSVRVKFDGDLEKALLELVRSGGSRPFKDLAPGDWTLVHVFTGPIASGARIAQELGQEVTLDGDGIYRGSYVQDGNLLVFQRHEAIVRMVSLGQSAALGDGRYSENSVLSARGGAIRVVEPDVPGVDHSPG